MEADQLSTKHISKLEQQVTQLLKTMRTAKLSDLPIYTDLQTLEQALAEARQQRFDKNDRDYPGF